MMYGRPAVPSIDVATAHARLAGETDRPILLDIREPADFRAGRAPGAMLRPVSTLHLTIGEIPPDRPVMVVCWEGHTSQSVAAFMLARGWSDVVSVEGGMSAWRRAGLPLERGDLAPENG